MNEQLLAAIQTATLDVDEAVTLPRARYLLLVREIDDPVAKLAEIEAALAPMGAAVRTLSTLESRTLVAEFPGRVFATDDATTFAAAYLMKEALLLEEAEPDLPTNFFPEADTPTGQKDPATESVEKLCFTEEQPELDATWALRSMRVEDAWAFSTRQNRPARGAGIIVAQPDTGITDHDELRNVRQASPRDVLNQDDDPTDPLEDAGNPGHGTGTGSVVVSPDTNTVVGVAPDAIHMPIRAIKSVIRITQGTVAEAIDWAVDHGAHVITMSLGGIPSFALHRAVRRAVAADVIVAAAAGNCVRTVVWPARYDDCIAVAGVNSTDGVWKGSCRGGAVDVSAPAENVFRARVGTPRVGQGQGTSFAVALTAGAAALWLAHHGRANLIAAARSRGETLQQMFRRLVMGTARRPADWDSFNLGAGIVNADELLRADFDLNRGLESAPLPDSDDERASVAIQSLVLETLGPDALPEDLDWKQFGPEIATALLRARATTSSDGDESMVMEGSFSPQLTAAPGFRRLHSRTQGGGR